MPRRKVKKLSKKEAKFQLKRRDQLANMPIQPHIQAKPERRTIEMPQIITVRNFANLSGIPIGKIIETLLRNGVKATINESIDFDTASIISDEFNLDLKSIGMQKTQDKDEKADKTKLERRPPVVTIMGHVDHGKTKLLDSIRETNVAEKESGGITQHIGAYQVEIPLKEGKRSITFLDTPGHEAFSSLRAHGANITDIVILVVAADDGVKPQTLEALSHARAANVPIIVAINKIDLPQADPQKVRRQLAEVNLLPEDWGGKTPVVEVSAKAKIGLNNLLELIGLISDLNPPMSSKTGATGGVIIESHVDPGSGPTATGLVMQGTIKVGDIITAGRAWGKVRFLKDWQNKRLENATPGMPVIISGLKSLPDFGDIFKQSETEMEARDQASTYSKPSLVKKAVDLKQQEGKNLALIIKADVSASLEALSAMLSPMKRGDLSVKIVSSGIGPVSETDVKQADASQAIVAAFRVPVAAEIKRIADQYKVSIKRFDVIYQVADEINSLLKSLVEPQITKKTTGIMDVVKIFMQAKDIALVGGKVSQGTITSGDYCAVQRNDNQVGEGKITTIQTGTVTLQEATKGQECGIKITKSAGTMFKAKQGDKIVAYQIERVTDE